MGDLFLLRDLARDKHLGRKLDLRWKEPRLVDWPSKDGISAYIWALYEPPDKAKRYHIDELCVYTPSGMRTIPVTTHASIVTYERDPFGDRTGKISKDRERLILRTSGGE